MAYNPNNVNGSATSANSAPVVIASDQTAIPVTPSLPTGAATETTLGTRLADSTFTTRIPVQGQALAAASIPVVLTAIQVTALTPPAAITGFSTEATLALIKAKTDNLDVLLSTRTKPADTQPVSIAAPVSITDPDTTSAGSLGALNAVTTLALTGDSAVAVEISGTWVGTISFEGTVGGSIFNPLNGVSSSTSSPTPTTTVNGLYRVTPAACASMQVKMSAYTSGTATISMRASSGVGGIFANQILPTKNTDGTSTQTIKASSTAAVAGDQPAVVALHPSSPTPAGTNAIGKFAIDQTTNIIAPTTMQNAAVAVGNGANLNVQGYASAIISITGTMSAGTTITFKESPDDVTFLPITAHQLGVAGNLSTTTIAIGEYRISCANLKSLQAVITTYGAGTITVKGYVSALAGHPTTVNTNIIAPLPPGSALVGKFGIDQTTPGTTNAVQVTNMGPGAGIGNVLLIAGTALVGKFGIDQTTPGTTNATSLAQINAATTLTGNGVTGTGSLRVTPASDATLNTNMTWNNGVVGAGVQRVTLASDSTGQVAIATRTTGGSTAFTLISAATTNATSVKTSAGTLYGIYAYNNGAAAAYLKIYNLAVAPTVGTSVAALTILLPAGGGSNIPIPSQGIAFGTGIAFAITGLGTTADATAVAVSQVFVNGAYI